MRRRLVAGLAVAAVASGLAFTAPARADSTDTAVAAGPADGLLVRFDESASARAVEHAVAAAGGTIEDVAAAPGFVKVATGAKPASAVQAALVASPVVEDVELNRLRTASAIPADQHYPSQAGFFDALRLPQAWDTTTGNDSLILAVIDSGVDAAHVDLKDRLLPGVNEITPGAPPIDDCSHGTMVTGLAGASTGSSVGVAAATWRGKILPIKVMRQVGTACTADDNTIIKGIRDAVSLGASVINLSLGGEGANDALCSAVADAVARGVVVVAAAGNSGGTRRETEPHYPAACTPAVSVGATDVAGRPASFSSSGGWVDVGAPGEMSANTTGSLGLMSTTVGGSYGRASGTSFASPLVAGIALLMRAADPGASAATLAARLVATAGALPAPFAGVFAHGMVNAEAALAAGSGSFSSASATGSGYWMLGREGAVYNFGAAARLGNAALAGGATAADLEPTPSGTGYWVVDSVGHVFSFGSARYLGGADGLLPGEQVTSLSTTPTGNGYWIFTTRGRVFNRGDAAKLGDLAAVPLNGPILDSIPTPSGLGYFMVGSDGGIFAFGDAGYAGSMGGKRLNAPVQSLVPNPHGSGYWLVASDGGVFAFGEAPFRGSMGGIRLNAPVTGMVPFGNGYLMVGTDGGAFNFSDQPFVGSLGANGSVQSIVAIAPKAASR